jgi:hypothetical protein
MNFPTAYEQMKSGKMVERKLQCMAGYVQLFLRAGYVWQQYRGIGAVNNYAQQTCMRVDDLDATDWEVVE